MERIRIFAIVKNALLAIRFAGSSSDEFAAAFNKWRDIEYLERFFEENKGDLQNDFYGNVSVEQAIWRTIVEAQKFEERVLEVARKGTFEDSNSLQDLVFIPLHKNDYKITHQESKAYGGRNSWLRIYAIRISSHLYVVTGSAIKLTKKMQDRRHTRRELKKLKLAAQYLREEGFESADDYGFIEIIE